MRRPENPAQCLHLMTLFDVNAPFCSECGQNMAQYWVQRRKESNEYGKAEYPSAVVQ